MAAADVIGSDDDDRFDIATVKLDGGVISYIDPVLAQTGKQIVELQDIVREAKRQIRLLEQRRDRRLKALNALGPLSQYPTKVQRDAIATVEQAVTLGSSAMVKMAYGLCVQLRAHQTAWRSDEGEPLAAYVARCVADIETRETATMLAAIEGTTEVSEP